MNPTTFFLFAVLYPATRHMGIKISVKAKTKQRHKPYMQTHKSAAFKRILLTATVTCILSSCSVIRIVEVESPTASSAGSGQHFSHYKTVRTSIWKSHNKLNLKSECPNGISRVKVTTRPADLLVGFVSLGFCVRQRLDWDCSQRSGGSQIDNK